MNWVGGARNRIKTKSDIKKQKEFFQKRRQENANNSKKRDSHNTPRLSRDLLTFNLLKIKSRKIYTESKPTKVINQDLDKFNTRKISHVNLPETPIAFDNYSYKIKEKTKVKAERYRAEEEENVDDISLIKGDIVRRNNSFNSTENTHPLQMSTEGDVQFQKHSSDFVPFYTENNSLMEFGECDDKEPRHQNNNEYKIYNADSQDVSFVQPLSELFHTKEGVSSVQPLNELINTKQDDVFVQPLNELLKNNYPHNIHSLEEPHSKRDCNRKEMFSIFDSSAKHKHSSMKLSTKNRRNYDGIVTTENENHEFARNNFSVHSQQNRIPLVEEVEECYGVNNKQGYKNYEKETFEEYSNAGNFRDSKFHYATILNDKDASQMPGNYFGNIYPKQGDLEDFSESDFMGNVDFVRKTKERNNMLNEKGIIYRNLNPDMASYLNTASFETYTRKTDAFKFSKENIDTEYENQDLEDYSIFQEQIFLIKQSKTRIHPDMLSRQIHTSDFNVNQTKKTGCKRKRNHNSGFGTHQQDVYFDNLNDDKEEEHGYNILKLKNNNKESLKTQNLSNCMDIENRNRSIITGAMESLELSSDETYYDKTRLPSCNSASTTPYVFSDSNQTFKNIIRHTEYQNFTDDGILKSASNCKLPIFASSTANMSSFSNISRRERIDKVSKAEKNESKLAHMNSNFALDSHPTGSFMTRNEIINNLESQNIKKNNQTYENRVFQEHYQNDYIDLPTPMRSKQHNVISKIPLSNNETLYDKDFDNSNINKYNGVFHSSSFPNVYETLKIKEKLSQIEDYSNTCSTSTKTGIDLKSKKVKHLKKSETMTPSTDYMKALQVKRKIDNRPVNDYSENLNFEINGTNTSTENTFVKTQVKEESSKELKNYDDLQEYPLLVQSGQSKVKSDFTESLNEVTLEVLKTNNAHLQNENNSKKYLQLPETENDFISKEIKNASENEFMTSEMASINIENLKILSKKVTNDRTFPYDDSENLSLRNNLINPSTTIAPETPKLTEKSTVYSQNQNYIKNRLILDEIELQNNKSGLLKDLNATTFEELKINDKPLHSDNHSNEKSVLPETENILISKQIKNTPENQSVTLCTEYVKVFSVNQNTDNTSVYNDSKCLNESFIRENSRFDSSIKFPLENLKFKGDCFKQLKNSSDNKESSILGQTGQLKCKSDLTQALNEQFSEVLKLNDPHLQIEDFPKKIPMLCETKNYMRSKGLNNSSEKGITTSWNDCIKVLSVKYKKDDIIIYDDSKSIDKSFNFEKNTSLTKSVNNKPTLIEEHLQQSQNNEEFKKCSTVNEASQPNEEDDLNETALNAILNCEVIINTEEESGKEANSSALEVNVCSPKQDDYEKSVTEARKYDEQSIPSIGEYNEYEENKTSQLDATTFEAEASSTDQLSTNTSDSQCFETMVAAKDVDFLITKVSTLPDKTDYSTGILISYKNLLNSDNDHCSPESTKYEKSSFNTCEVGTQTIMETFDFGCQVSF